MNVDGSGLVRLTDNLASDTNPNFSPKPAAAVAETNIPETIAQPGKLNTILVTLALQGVLFSM